MTLLKRFIKSHQEIFDMFPGIRGFAIGNNFEIWSVKIQTGVGEGKDAISLSIEFTEDTQKEDISCSVKFQAGELVGDVFIPTATRMLHHGEPLCIQSTALFWAGCALDGSCLVAELVASFIKPIRLLNSMFEFNRDLGVV